MKLLILTEGCITATLAGLTFSICRNTLSANQSVSSNISHFITKRTQQLTEFKTGFWFVVFYG